MRGHLWGCSITLCLLASCSSFPSGSPEQGARVDEFIDRSYLHQELMQVSNQMTQLQSAKVAPTVSEAESKGLALSREIGEALRPESTMPLMRDYLRTQRPETLERLLEWLRTPLTQRMLTFAAQPFDYGGFNTYQVPKDGPRQNLIPRLDKATHTSDLAIEETIERTKILGPFFAEKQQAAQSDGKLSPMIEQFVRAQHLRKQAFIYRSASDQDLQQYIEFLESPLGQTYVMVRRNALVAAHSKAQAVMAKLMTVK